MSLAGADIPIVLRAGWGHPYGRRTKFVPSDWSRDDLSGTWSECGQKGLLGEECSAGFTDWWSGLKKLVSALSGGQKIFKIIFRRRETFFCGVCLSLWANEHRHHAARNLPPKTRGQSGQPQRFVKPAPRLGLTTQPSQIFYS
jgi:hypothetical protein